MKQRINRSMRLTAWLLTLAMIFAMIPVFSLTAVAANETVDQEPATVTIETVSPSKSVTLNVDSTDGYYTISTADELDAFSVLVRTTGAVYAKLTANITYNSGDLSTLAGKTDGYREYMPAGMTEVMSPVYSKSYNVFTGTLDGQGYTISGLYYSKGHNSGLEGYGGLVSKLGNGGVIKNLTITKSYFADVSMVGAFAGDMASGSLIENCHNVGTTVRAGRYVGGIAGYVEGGAVKGCTNSGKIENYKVNDDISTVTTAGGIAGYVKGSSGLVEVCSNSGTVNATACGGGIAGEAWDGGTVQNCLNTGTVSVPKGINVGGIVGYVYQGNVHNNLCLGSVTGYQTVGHVIGGVGTIKSYSNNYHCHTVTVTRADSQTIHDESKVTAVDSAALASGEVAYLLGSAWGQNIDNDKPNQGSPVLGGAKVYYGYVSCAEDAVMVYTNTTASAEKPGHTLTYTASGTTITESCSANCGHTATATISAEDTTYTGVAQEKVSVAYSDGWLGGELTISYANNTDAGTATAFITVGDAIAPTSVTDDGATVSVEFFIAKATPSYTPPTGLTAAYGDTLADVQLPEGFSWKDATASVGNLGSKTFTAIFTPEDTDNYNTVECELEVTVEQKVVEQSAVTLSQTEYVYDGLAKTPAVNVEIDGVTLIPRTDFEVSYSENVNAGQAFVTVTFMGNYSGEVTKNFEIIKAIPIVIVPTPNTLTYDGSAQELVVAGYTNGGTMEYSLDGEVWSPSIPKPIQAGTYKVYYRVVMSQNYEEVNNGDYVEAEIMPIIVTEATVTLSKTEYEYDGTAKTPNATVILDGVVLYDGIDYDVSYSDNIRVGTVIVTISFKGNYTGTANATFEITCEHVETELQLVAPYIMDVCNKCSAPAGFIMVMGNPMAVYNGEAHEVKPWANGTLAEAPYTLSYTDENGQPVEAMIDAGTYTVTLTYEGLSTSCKMTVHPALGYITVDNAVKTYGDADPVYTYTYEMVLGAIPEGDDMGVFFTREEGEDVGTYIITPHVSNPNYDLRLIDDAPSATLTVVPRVAELVWDNTTLEFNGERQAPTASVGNLVGDDTCTVTVTGNGKYAGTFTAEAVALDNPNYVLPADVTTEYTIWADSYKVVNDIVPESVKTAVSDAVSTAVEDAMAEIGTALRNAVEDALENVFNSFMEDLKGRLSKMFG